jgi:hypothetical protein
MLEIGLGHNKSSLPQLDARESKEEMTQHDIACEKASIQSGNF